MSDELTGIASPAEGGQAAGDAAAQAVPDEVAEHKAKLDAEHAARMEEFNRAADRKMQEIAELRESVSTSQPAAQGTTDIEDFDRDYPVASKVIDQKTMRAMENHPFFQRIRSAEEAKALELTQNFVATQKAAGVSEDEAKRAVAEALNLRQGDYVIAADVERAVKRAGTYLRGLTLTDEEVAKREEAAAEAERKRIAEGREVPVGRVPKGGSKEVTAADLGRMSVEEYAAAMGLPVPQ